MKRDLTFSGSGQMAAALGCDPGRISEIESGVSEMIDHNASLRAILEHFNDRGDLTDAEWTALVFSLGHFDGRRQR